MKNYRLTKEERDATILRVVQRINDPVLTRAGKESKRRWEKGWGEILTKFIRSKYNLDMLVPQYIHDDVIRYRGDYAIPAVKDFELKWYNQFRKELFNKYLNTTAPVYEFGCGTGYNLVALAKMDLDRDLHGLDWVEASKDILDRVRLEHRYNVHGHVFDMFNPDPAFKIPKGAAMLAIGALEQLGADFEPFLKYVLKQKPSIFVHVDSFIEMYDKTLFDQLAVMFDLKRNYLRGYLTRLRQLRDQGVIEILEERKSPFGSLYHDGYSVVVWRPAKQ